MDVKEFLLSTSNMPGIRVELTGWLVDQAEGLFLLGDHYPEDYSYPFKIKISNSNIMYQIIKTIPQLGGGKSSLFYKAKIAGFTAENEGVDVDEIYIQSDRKGGDFCSIDISKEKIYEMVSVLGDYKFNRNRDPMRDWINDFD
ncbi:MAG: hypothetical protein Q4G70_11440 [Pseudomonadota bacterium]|nr:hypothetical protein [Pseudomonadota bacterium]